jgi:hypothetical protein
VRDGCEEEVSISVGDTDVEALREKTEAVEERL